MPTKWFFEADYLQACNCEYGCPCEFQAPPSHGFCAGVGAWKINRGKFGDIPLDGLALGFAAHWPKALHLGNGTVSLLFEERADQSQRDALMQIATGQAGGMPFEILVTTFSNILPPHYIPFEFRLNGKDSSVRAGTVMQIATEPVKNPVTGEPEGMRIEHETGFIFKTGEVVSGKVCESNIDGLRFVYPNKAAFIASIRYGN
ncbi:MAG TPA: DUF1326 domain-containing protein [Bryobacteraceae bacterium]|nr:DUF1326 domain-containing protein [Bryobacteraceae bacterium]